LEHATYSVASPEACASIIWRTAEKASDAAEAMKVSAQELIKIKIVDEIIKEPLGGAHRDYKEISESVRSCILKNLGILLSKPVDEVLEARYKKLLEIG
jgi:acetyl-CoA carboxylase carboxyl transferase subunit alpha